MMVRALEIACVFVCLARANKVMRFIFGQTFNEFAGGTFCAGGVGQISPEWF